MSEKLYPETLKRFPIWALWKLEPGKNGRMTKVPYSPHYDGRASSTNLDSWGTFSDAVRKYESRPNYYDGVALVISKQYGLIFIDIDHCIAEDGTLNEIALDVIDAISRNSFVEISQSGSGLHFILQGYIPRNFKNSQNGVEIYSDKRFIAMTGDVLIDGEPSMNQPVLNEIYQRYKTPEKIKKRLKTDVSALSRSDKWVIQHAEEHGRFKSLYSGNWSAMGYGSQSEADQAMCLILAFWTGCDADQMDRVFRSSGLYREKWERKDYREATLHNAIDQCELTLSEYINQKNRERGDALDRALSENWD